MFEENKNDVTEVTENAEEQTAEEMVDTNQLEDSENIEETVEEDNDPENIEDEEEKQIEKMFTSEEVDGIKQRYKKRLERKLRREYDEKYSRLENVVKAGLNTSDLNDATERLAEYYENEGVDIPNGPKYSDDDIRLLANAEANEFIESSTYEEIADEVDELAKIGFENMSERDKIVFSKLADKRKSLEEEKAVLSLGINKDELSSEDFKEFSNKLNPDLPIKEKYEMFLKLKPKKQAKQMGSMKSGPVSKVKDYYTEEEISKLTDEELDDPKIWEAVRNSMTGRA